MCFTCFSLKSDNIQGYNGLLLAHLARGVKVSFCDTGLSVARRASVRVCMRASISNTFNIFFSKTVRQRHLIFGM